MTVIRWIKEGKIPAFKTAGGHRRIQRADLMRFCRARGIPLTEEPTEGGRVLVIDGDAAVRDAIAETARAVDAKLAIECTGDAFTGGQLLAEFRPGLLFLDQRLPGVDALELTARLARDVEGEAPAVAVLLAQNSADTERVFRSRGAMACLTKPPAALAVERVVRVALNLPEAAAGLPRIHIVDSDARAGKSLRRELENRGYGVTLFDSAIEALLALPVETPDLLVLDLGDLDVNTTAFIRRVSARGNEVPLPIVALAPPRGEDLGNAAVTAGAKGFVLKPCSVEEVVSYLRPVPKRRRQG
jgi:excisionase family DNA binding protein